MDSKAVDSLVVWSMASNAGCRDLFRHPYYSGSMEKDYDALGAHILSTQITKEELDELAEEGSTRLPVTTEHDFLRLELVD